MLIRDGSLWPMRMLRTYKQLRTLLFMVSSAIIVDSLYLNSDAAFWLFKPLKKYAKHDDHNAKPIDEDRHHICHHAKGCDFHILQVSFRHKSIFHTY